MRTIRITGMGSYLPRRMLANEELPQLDKPISDAQLERIGVSRRGWAAADETVPAMAASAAQVALGDAGVSPEQLDFIILANWTQRRMLPDFAPRVQDMLGAPHAFAFDVGTACAGFAYGVELAWGLLQSRRRLRGLVVASETTSLRARPHSAATLVFGDAAGAWVLEAETERGARLIDVELGTDGGLWQAMTIDAAGHVRTHIDQKQLQRAAAESFRSATAAVLERNGMTLDDVDWVVPHSGTAGIQALVLRVLEVSPDKVLTNFSTIGNVSSAAIPAALCQFRDEGVIRPGDIVVSPTTGSGWYSAAMLYQL